MVNLGVLPGFAGSGAAAVSADGSVIVGSSWPEQGDAAAFIWDSASGMRELRAVLGERGVLVPASALEGAVGISADGRTIVGNGHWENPVGSPNMGWIAFLGEAVCYPDCNVDGTLTVADFGCFQTKFVAGDPYADCNADGGLTVADFGCFQTSFVTGCP
jgi:probable HAF family extracellular repeat protein